MGAFKPIATETPLALSFRKPGRTVHNIKQVVAGWKILERAMAKPSQSCGEFLNLRIAPIRFHWLSLHGNGLEPRFSSIKLP
jgi:hypothetical protein